MSKTLKDKPRIKKDRDFRNERQPKKSRSRLKNRFNTCTVEEMDEYFEQESESFRRRQR